VLAGSNGALGLVGLYSLCLEEQQELLGKDDAGAGMGPTSGEHMRTQGNGHACEG
jgi:hypothetical protein